MNKFVRLLVLLPVLVLSACGDHDKDDPVAYPAGAPINQEFLIGYGESVEVGRLKLEFSAITEESRCPLNATCVWAGNARILVKATGRSGTQMLEFNTTPGFGSTAHVEGYFLELRRLDPVIPLYPYPPPQDYTATIFVRSSNP